MNQIFDFASTLATSFLTGDAEEIDPADFAAQSYMNELDMIQLQMDETQLLAEINEAVEALIGEEEESQGEERTIADLEEEKQKELEDLGLDSKTTVKEANELIKRVQEQQQQVQKLRSPDMFVKDENGKWVLTEEAGDGQEVSYAKNPPFYSQEVTQRILNDSQSIIEENPNQFYQLAAIELGGDGRFNMGTLYDVLRGNMDLDNPEAPEVIALNYLRDPSNEEAKEAFNQMIQEPANNGIKVAVAEAFARAAGKLMNEHMSNAEKNF